MNKSIVFLALFSIIFVSVSHAKFLIIAHRGASGYLPEHTSEAKVLAYAQGADYIEQDVVMTKDNQLIVFHDIFLNDVTDVAKKFPGKKRNDGKFYVIDFSLRQIQQLTVHSRYNQRKNELFFPNRFPYKKSTFAISTLKDEIELIRGLNRTLGKGVGLYVEIKNPSWHRKRGKDISLKVLDTLQNYGYSSRSAPVFLQCFDADELIRIRKKLKSDLKLVQLMGENGWFKTESDYDFLKTKAGIKYISEYADGIGFWLPHIYERVGRTSLVHPRLKWTKKYGMFAHVYTIKNDFVPVGFANADEVVQWLAKNKVDGVFTDFPDTSKKAYEKLNMK